MNYSEFPIKIGDQLFVSISQMSDSQIAFTMKTIMFLWEHGKNQSCIEVSGEKWRKLSEVLNRGEAEIELMSNEIAHMSGLSLLTLSLEATESGFSRILTSPYLKKIHDKIKEDEMELSLLTEKSLIRLKSSEESMYDLVSKSDEVSRLYLKPNERKLDVFCGWFPLASFHEDGAAFNLRKGHKDMLTSQFAKFGIDIEETLYNIFVYLVQNPSKRKTYSFMNNFINNWFRGMASSTKEKGNIKKIKNNLCTTDGNFWGRTENQGDTSNSETSYLEVLKKVQ